MDSVVVTIKLPSGTVVDLALPIAVPISVVAPLIMEGMGETRGSNFEYRLKFKDGPPLDSARTLADAGVVNSDLLQLEMRPVANIGGTLPLHHDGAMLIAENNVRMYIPSTMQVVLIGREDPATGNYPPIDLTHLDPKCHTSRRHANLRIRNGVYFIEGYKQSNEIYINGQRISGQYSLRDGDVLQFWPNGVELTFQSGKTENRVQAPEVIEEEQ